MEKIDLFKILKNQGLLENIMVYPAKETTTDPYEKTKEITNYNPIPIKGLIYPISFSSLKWKYYGQLPMGSKGIVVEKRYKSLLINAFKIKIGEDYYKCYKDDVKGFAIKESSEYVLAVLEWKNE